MSMTSILVLDENTANQIAAGEVVERPASVIKELVENSIDAGSRNIEVEIADGGISFIRVTDDGIGMGYEDAKLAILRHATSKIRVADDLGRIATLGFRGEALPTIAAVAKFALTTRLHHQPLATYVEVHGGSIMDVREAGANVGTTVKVTDLFYNTPARKKFLKTPASESSHIHDILVKLALSHPDIAFKLINNNRLVLSTPGNNQLLDTLTSLYGSKVMPELLPVQYHEDDITISGYLSKPTLLKSSRQWQTFIVNSRIINSRSIAKALDNAYHSLLPKNGYPLAVLNISVPINTVDVNVHPQKSEIKFADESKIFKAIYKAVIETLKAPHEPKQIAATITPNLPRFQQTSTSPSFTQFPSTTTQPTNLWKEQSLPITTAKELIKQAEPLTNLANPVLNLGADTEEADASVFSLNPLGQFDECYIIAYNHDGLFIIDQHAAHERILYDKLCKAAERIPSQQLLVPLVLDFDEKECNIILENKTMFYELGFTLELFGPNTVRLLELPADIPACEAEPIMRQILAAIQNMHNPSPQELRHTCLQITACRAAIKAGESLNMRQIQALISELCTTTLPYTCPHGRPSVIRFSSNDLAKMFKRT